MHLGSFSITMTFAITMTRRLVNFGLALALAGAFQLPAQRLRFSLLAKLAQAPRQRAAAPATAGAKHPPLLWDETPVPGKRADLTPPCVTSLASF